MKGGESVSCSVVSDFVTSRTVARQAPLSLQFSRPRILEFALPSSRGSSNPEIKPGSPALQADSLPSESPGKPRNNMYGFLQAMPLSSGFRPLLSDSMRIKFNTMLLVKRCNTVSPTFANNYKKGGVRKSLYQGSRHLMQPAFLFFWPVYNQLLKPWMLQETLCRKRTLTILKGQMKKVKVDIFRLPGKGRLLSFLKIFIPHAFTSKWELDLKILTF